MNRTELNWLLQTITDAETAERFVLAQYQSGRISIQMMADVARERRCIDLANQFMNMTTGLNNEYAGTELIVV